MSTFEFLFSNFLLLLLAQLILVYRSISKKSPRTLLRYFFLPVVFSMIFGALLQHIYEVSEISNRQIIANILLLLWCTKSFFSYKSIKPLLLNSILSEMRLDLDQKNYLNLIKRVIKVSCLQFICFSFIYAINYLSGNLAFNLIDWVGLVIALLGVSIEIYCETQIKTTKKNHLLSGGIWAKIQHPNLLGIILFFLGLQILATGAIGSKWTVIGFFIIFFILQRILMPELDKKLLMRFGKEPSLETSYGYKKALFIK